MKTKLLLSSLFTFVFYLLSSQVPQGINYQAIARDGAGAILDNKTFNIELTIQTSTGTEIWKELKLVTSNQFGLVNEVLGTGTNLVVQGLASFSMIDWNAQPLYLKTRVQYPGTTWNLLGTSQLWSVPYSLVAKDLEGPVSKLGIEGTTTNGEESLFEVKNKNGEIVFAVYNEGVRVYVPDGAKGAKGGFAVSGWSYNKAVPENYLFVGPDSIRAYIWDDPLEKGAKGGFTVSGFNTSKSITNEFLNISPDSVRIYIDKAPSTKGAKGGFTVSGFGAAKGEEEEYLRVTRDSTRIYINDETTPKGAKGGFAVSGFANAKGVGAANYLNVATDTTGIINPSQNRILWYPIKNAFLTGKVLIHNPDSVGENSFASGFESRAAGKYSQALGYKAIALGDYSTAIGKYAKTYNSSFALGDSAMAGIESYAFGRGATARGYRSFALGSAGIDYYNEKTSPPIAYGDYSFAIGQGSQALDLGTFAIGLGCVAQGLVSTAIGYKSYAQGDLSIAIGNEAWAKGTGSIALGGGAYADGQGSIAGGNGSRTWSTAPHSFAFGNYVHAMGECGVAFGERTKAGPWALAHGLQTYSSYFSIAVGDSCFANGYSLSVGERTLAKSVWSNALGRFNYDPVAVDWTPVWRDTDPLFMIGNGTSESDRRNAFTILKNGKTAIGHSAPTQMLDVSGNARFRAIGSAPSYGALNRTSDGTLTTAISDIRFKENIYTLQNGLTKVLDLRGVYFNWISEPEMGRRVGMIAQEVEKVIPELVFTNEVDGYKGINYAEMSAVLVEAIKEQQTLIEIQNIKIETQQQQIESYKSQLQSLEEKVEKIEALMTKTLVE